MLLPAAVLEDGLPPQEVDRFARAACDYGVLALDAGRGCAPLFEMEWPPARPVDG